MTAASLERKTRKVRIGTVVSDKMDMTITVAVERRVQHTLYKKYLKRTKKLLAHNPDNSAKLGDKVSIMECRPLSKRKSWRLLNILERAR